MSLNIEQVNKELYGFLASKGFDPTMLDMDGGDVPTPDAAVAFQFKFKEDGIEYDDVTISIDANRDMTVYCDNEVARGPNRSRHGDSGWLNFELALKEFALRKCQLTAFHISNQSNLKHDMLKRKCEDEYKLNEGYKAINKKTSVNDKNPGVKVVLKHSKTMEEGDQRFRHVEKIFLETSDGQRFLAPTQSSAVAALYARHLAEGGLPYCEKWNHIGSLVEEYSKMRGFVNATRNKQFNESTQELMNEALNHYQSLRETLKKLGGKRGYNTYFESWTPTLMEDEDDADMSEMFVNPSIDARIMEAMPILKKLQKKKPDITETLGDEFETWANDITETSESEAEAHKGWFGVDESVETLPDTDQILQYMTSAFKSIQDHRDVYGNIAGIEKVYKFLRSSLLDGDFEEYSKSYDEALRHYPDETSELLDSMFEEVGLNHNSTIEDFYTKISSLTEAEPDTNPEVADYVDPEEAEYDDEYDQMVTRAGKFAKGGQAHDMLNDIKRLSGISK